MAAGAVTALTAVTGCGAAAPDVAESGATPTVNGPYGVGGPFATAGTATDGTASAGPASAAPADGGSAGLAGSVRPGTVRVDGSTAFNGNRSVPWLAALGYGVVVSAPTTVQPSTAVPGDAEAGFYDAYYSHDLAAACGYVVPAEQAQCPASLRRSLPAAGSLQDAAVGFVVIKSDEAIVTLTGLVCGGRAAPDGCLAQHDPAWVFGNAGTFDTLWARIAAEGGNPLTATPLRQEAGHWYVDLLLPASR